MKSASEIRHKEAAVLIRAVENLFRKLVKFLVGRISLKKLQQILRYVFVEEAEKKLRSENSYKNVSLTKLALTTGLDTRTLTKIRNSKEYGKSLSNESSFLRDLAPGASILDEWSSNSSYVNRGGAPRPLRISGGAPSFESLFNKTSKARGVTYKSLLDRLIESRSVNIDEGGNVHLVSKSYLPAEFSDELGAIEMGFSAIGNLVDTVTSNIFALEKGDERLFQRGAWTYRLNASKRDLLKSELSSLLEETEHQARKIIEDYEDDSEPNALITAGASLFYFEETDSPKLD